MKTILVPTDFSLSAKNALNYAVEIAKKERAKIVLLHAFNVTYVSPDVPMIFYDEQIKALEKEVKGIMEGLCVYARKQGKVECVAVSRQGLAVDVILETSQKKKVDLIVMGTKGASGVKEVLIGSNTSKVILKSKRPVIAVPEKFKFNGIKKIVFATDFHPGDIVALKKLIELAMIYKAKIQIVHIADIEYADEKGFMEKFAKLVKKKIEYKHIAYQMLNGIEADKKLQQYLKKESADLISITTADKSLLERLFERSTSKKLVYHTKIPLIAFHYTR